MRRSRAQRHRSCAWPSRGIAIVAAHPDDEVLGLGGRIAELGALTLVHLTDGAPRDMRDARSAGFETREAYARARAVELDRALTVAGARVERRVALGVADQETLFRLEPIARELIPVLAGVQCVITHPYEGGHPDHDAAAFAVAAACARLAHSMGRAPRRLEFPSYHAVGETVWRGVFWDDRARPETAFELDSTQRERKRAALAEFASQRAVVAEFPIAIERVRSAPEYDFTCPPPPGAVLYDRLDWGIDSGEWRCEAARALAALELG